jgi:hypothetical protein
MPTWITVYCRTSVAHIHPADILMGIQSTNLFTAAQAYDIHDAEIVREALAHMHVDPGRQPGFVAYELSYRPSTERQVMIRRWTEPAVVQADIADTFAKLAYVYDAGADWIRAHLGQVQEIVAIEMGRAQLDDMGVVLAYEVARWLATIADGLIEADDGAWWIADQGEFKQILSGRV